MDLFCSGITKNSENFVLGIFLSKPQAWYIIAARSAVHIIKGGEPPLYLITRQRVSSCDLMICNSYGIDDIHGYAVMIYTPSA